MLSRIGELEQVIAEGLHEFIRVGRALTAIRDERLYLETHTTFRSYCEERWEISSGHANRLITAAEVEENLPEDIGKPSHESHYRQLSKLPEEDQGIVWSKVYQKHQAPTAGDVKQEIDTYLGIEDKPKEIETDPLALEDPLAVASWLVDHMSVEAYELLLGITKEKSQSEGSCLVCGSILGTIRKTATILEDGFAEFWGVCHRRVGKEAAKKAFSKAVDRGKKEGRTLPESVVYLVSRMKLFAKSPQAQDEIKGTIHPATWLNQARYDDDDGEWSNGKIDGKEITPEKVEEQDARERKLEELRRRNADQGRASETSGVD